MDNYSISRVFILKDYIRAYIKRSIKSYGTKHPNTFDNLFKGMENRKYKRNRKRNCATQTKLEQKQRDRTSSATNRWTVELKRGPLCGGNGEKGSQWRGVPRVQGGRVASAWHGMAWKYGVLWHWVASVTDQQPRGTAVGNESECRRFSGCVAMLWCTEENIYNTTEI